MSDQYWWLKKEISSFINNRTCYRTSIATKD